MSKENINNIMSGQNSDVDSDLGDSNKHTNVYHEDRSREALHLSNIHHKSDDASDLGKKNKHTNVYFEDRSGEALHVCNIHHNNDDASDLGDKNKHTNVNFEDRSGEALHMCSIHKSMTSIANLEVKKLPGGAPTQPIPNPTQLYRPPLPPCIRYIVKIMRIKMKI